MVPRNPMYSSLEGLSPAGMAASLAALVRPCSWPASDKLARAPRQEARHADRNLHSRHRYRQELVSLLGLMIAAQSCCARSGRVARWRRDLPTCRRASSAWRLAPGRIVVLVKVGPKQWERYGLKSWIEAAKQRLHHNVLAIALANKLARIAWAVLHKGRAFECVKTNATASRSA